MARKIVVGDQEITIPTFNIGGLAILLLVVGAWFVLSPFMWWVLMRKASSVVSANG